MRQHPIRPMTRLAASVILLMLAAVPLRANGDAGIDRLYQALELPELIELMGEEGISQSDALAYDYLPFPPGEGWARMMQRIYDTPKMEAAMLRAFRADLDGADTGPLVDFFTSDLGVRIVDLELEARRAFLDPAAEEAAHEELTDPDTDKGRLALIDRYIEVNDLVEFNVMGALNSNYHFYRGLTETGTFEMTQEEMLAEVWSQEEQTRANTLDWLRAFLLVAYDGLTDDELRAYVDLSETEEGQRLNRALFKGFELMYDDVYRALGLAVAYQMSAEDL